MNDLEIKKLEYIDLLDKVIETIKKLDNILNSISDLNQDIYTCYTINDTLIDDDKFKDNEDNINNMRDYLNDIVRVEILDKIVELNQQING